MNVKNKKFIVFATLLMMVGVFLTVYSTLFSCKAIVASAIKNGDVSERFMGKHTAIYLITDLNTNCRPCSKFDELSKQQNTQIRFYLSSDYSNNDIENFRIAFNIPERYNATQMPAEWGGIFSKCNDGKDRKNNILIIINEKEEIEMTRF